ncbi:MAG: acyl-CoA dehydrogenase family protein [Rhodovarius sp.]|nr:acyl-CoA dehydrogenase family protein [Rhodovarius sp.]
MHIAPQGAAAVPDSRGLNFFLSDPWGPALLRHHLPPALYAHLVPHLVALGALVGAELDDEAAAADANPPVLLHRTRRGEDIQRIAYHPAYLAMARRAFADYGMAAMNHRAGVLGWPEPLPPIAKYAFVYLFTQSEFGLMCPVSMTDSLARTLRRFGSPELIARYLPALTSTDMDALLQGGMFMTEQGAGSDIANTAVIAEPAPDGTWRLFGDKWFCSNPDCGLALVLARRLEPDGQGGLAPVPAMRGVSLFLLPRDLPDGRRNAYRIVRLKEKLGSRSMASGEIRLEGATAWLVGDPEAGFRQMADMVNNSRLSNGVRAAGLMRRAVAEAVFVATRRIAFGRRLIEMPLMRRQLVKLILPAEQARSMMFAAAEQLRRADLGEETARRLLRILTPLIKFRACRDARRVAGDAMEVRGGCGYIEEFPDARILRDAHLGSIWEGTSNIVALDVLRAAERERALEPLAAYVAALLGNDAEGYHAALARAVALTRAAMADPALARAAASALYHITTAALLRAEGRALPCPAREALAELVLRHRLCPRDPLAAQDDRALTDLVLARAAAA